LLCFGGCIYLSLFRPSFLILRLVASSLYFFYYVFLLLLVKKNQKSAAEKKFSKNEIAGNPVVKPYYSTPFRNTNDS
jgi:hypothetical protein